MTPEEFLRKTQGTAQVNTQPTPAPTTQSGAMSPEDFLRAAKGEATLPPAPAVSVSELEPTKIPDGFTAPNEPEKKNNWLTAGRGILRQGADSVNTTLTGANKWLMGKEGLIGGPLNELKVMLGIGLQDIGETKKSFGDTFGIEKKSETGQKLMGAGRKVVNSENIADKIHDKYVKDAEIDREFYAKNAEGNKVMEVANKYAPTVVAAVPNMVMAYLTKGGSMLGTTTKGVAQTAQAATAVGADKIAAVLGNAMKRIASDPVTQTSFLQTTGASYSDALADGVSADEAAVYSLLNGYLGAMIETGGADDALGGMEAFPRKLSEAMAGRDKKKVLMDYAKSIVGEAGEEVSQGIVERGLKPMYGKETSILPTEGVENAVIDPRVMAEEAIGGALGAGVLGAPGAMRGVRAANVQNRANQLVPEMNAQPKAKPEVKAEAEIQPEVQEPVVEPVVEVEPEKPGISYVRPKPRFATDDEHITRRVLKPQENVQPVESVITPSEIETQQKPLEAPKGKLTENGAVYGATGKTYSSSNKPFGFRYAVVDANDLITSNDQYGNENSAYPKELQPRDRKRTASQMQIQSMAKSIVPELLADSPTAQNGAPIIRDDGAVIGGNARTQAIKEAYRSGNGDAYYQFLKENAQRLGIDPSRFPNAPVLVRIADGDSDTDWPTLAQELNTATTASYSATERAFSDAQRMGNAVSLVVPNDDGNLNTAANKEFISVFVSDVVPDAEKGSVTTSDGMLSRDGLIRAENAIFAYAYGDTELIERLSENLDNDAKNVTNMMLQTAGKAVSIQDGVKRGTLHKDIDVVKSVLNAVNLYIDAKKAGMTVDDYTAQASMGQYWSEQDFYLAHFIEQNKRSTKRLREFFNDLYNAALNSGDPNQTSMINEEGADYGTERFVDEAARKYEERTGEKFERPEYFGASDFFGGFEETVPVRTGNVAEDKITYVARDSGGNENNNPAVGERIEQPVKSTVVKPTKRVPTTVSEKENVQPPAEPFTYPEGDSNDRERGLSSNLRTDDYTAPEIKEVFEDDPLLYQQLSNNGTLQKAVDIWNSGFDTAKSQVDTALYNAKNGKTITPEIVPLTKIVANELAKQGKVDEAVAMETDLAATLTFYGQITQAARILRHGGTGSVLTAIQKTVDMMNADLKSRAKKGKTPVEITIDEKLIEKYNEQTTNKGRDEVIHEMQKSIAQQMPSTFMEKINALRYTNMLGNFKTQVRNIIGNTANLSRIKLSNVLAEMIEKASGTERTKSIYAGKQLLSEAKEDFDNVRDEIMGGGKFSDYKRKFGNEIQGERTIFKANGDWGKSIASPAYGVRRATDVLMKGMEGYRKATEFVMDYGDVIFARAAYADALGGWLKAHGYNSMTNVDAETLAKGKAYAIKEAQKATFREDTALTEFMQGMRYKGNNPVKKAASTVGEAIMPFLKTPANVFTQGVEASPIGAIKTVFDIKKLKTGDMSATDFISELSKNVTGSALFAVGMWLKAIGKARASGGDDEEAAEYTKQMGEMDYAVDLNGNGEWSTVDWASPMSLPFFMGVSVWDAVESEGLNASTALQALSGINNAMIEMSMFKGVRDVIDDLGSTFKNGEVDVDKFTKLLISAATSYASQLLNNSLYRQAEYASDKTRQTSYTDPDSKLGSELQYPVSKLTRGLPGDYNMQEYLDAWGRPQENGSASERVINSFLNPANTSKNRKTEIDDELLRLHEATKDLDVGAKVLPSRPARSTKVDDVRLSPDEYYDYAKTKGNLSLGLVTDFAKSERYKSLDDAEKAQVVSDLYTFAADQAADEIRRQRGAEFKNKMAKEEELAKKGQLTDYFLFKTAYKERAKAEDYEGIGKLMDDYDSLPKAVKESLGDDVEALNDSGLEPKAFFNVESLKKEYSKGGAFKRVSQIMSSGISAEEQKYVAESILGDNQLRQYNAAVSKLGMTPFEAVDFLLNANTGTDSQTSKTEAKEAARGTKKYSDAVIEAFLNAAYGE